VPGATTSNSAASACGCILASTRRHHPVAARWDALRRPDRFVDRHRHDLRASHGHHLPKIALANQPGRRAAKSRCQHPVERRRRASTLDVPEHGRADLVADALAKLVGEPDADATESREAVRPDPLGDRGAADRMSALGHDDDAERPPPIAAVVDGLGHPLDPERYLRDQDDVASAGQAGLQRDPAGVSTHHLDDHHPVMGLRRRAEAIDRVGRGSDGRVEPERQVGRRQIVVDRLRHADHRDAELLETQADPHRAVAADHDERVDLVPSDALDDVGGAVDDHLLAVDHRPEGERVATIARAEDRAALGQDAPHVLAGQRPDAVREDEALETVEDAEDLPVVVGLGRLHEGADHGVQARAVAAGRQDADPSQLPLAHRAIFREQPPASRLYECTGEATGPARRLANRGPQRPVGVS
jgi:hypothetical protein